MDIKQLLIGVLMILSTFGVAQEEGQPSKYGEDELECKKNLSLYVTFYQQKNYTDAMLGWRYVFDECPRASKNIYIHGVKMFSKFIAQETDETKKEALIDSLMLIYDRRIEFFGEKGRVEGRKGVDLYKNRGDKVTEEAYTLLKSSLDERQNKTEGGVLVYLMQTALKLQAEEKVKCDEIVDIYAKSIDAIDAQIKKYEEKSKDPKNLLNAKANIDKLFVSCPCASCEAVIPIFKSKFEAESENVDLLKNIVIILGKQGCTDDPLYAEVAENLIRIDSSAIDPYNMGKFFKKKNEYNKAVRFFKQALEIKTDPNDKADIYYELADIYGNNLGQKAQGRTYAYEAIKLKPNWGKPYLLIGLFYASSSSSCGDSDVAKKAVTWVAVDKFQKAKTVDPSFASEANKLIGKYSGYFPTKEDAFFIGIQSGQSYKVGCWINETTTARFNN